MLDVNDSYVDEWGNETRKNTGKYNFLNHPAFTNPVAIMPDTHAGMGSVIGFTMQMTDKITPNVVGVDINCGMLSFQVTKNLFATYPRDYIDSAVRIKIPFGMSVHNNSRIDMKQDFPWEETTTDWIDFISAYRKKYNSEICIDLKKYRHVGGILING